MKVILSLSSFFLMVSAALGSEIYPLATITLCGDKVGVQFENHSLHVFNGIDSIPEG